MIKEANPNRILTPEEAAEVLQVSKRTMYEWLRTGQVLGTQVGPRLWRIREGDIISPDVRALLELGLIHDAHGRVEDGASAFQRALELNPRYNLANFCLGNMCYRWGHYYQAEKPLLKAIELNPDWVAAYGTLGMNYNHADRFSEAEPILRKAIELAPDYAGNYYQLGYSLLQQHYFKNKETIEMFRKAVELDTKHRMALSFLGDVLLRERDFEGSREVYEKLKELSETAAEALLKRIEWTKQQYVPRAM